MFQKQCMWHFEWHQQIIAWFIFWQIVQSKDVVLESSLGLCFLLSQLVSELCFEPDSSWSRLPNLGGCPFSNVSKKMQKLFYLTVTVLPFLRAALVWRKRKKFYLPLQLILHFMPLCLSCHKRRALFYQHKWHLSFQDRLTTFSNSSPTGFWLQRTGTPDDC